MKRMILLMAFVLVLGVLTAIGAGTVLGGSGPPCTNNGCKTTADTTTVKDAGNSGGFTQESTTTQQNSPNSPNPNKDTTESGPCTNPGGQPNCPHS
jgi:hypothetical protein